MSTACPKCGSRYLRPSRARDFAETLGQFRFVTPLRCLDCNSRFIGKTFVWADTFYARCPECHRMDLNRWTGKTYIDPPFWVAFKVFLGAHKWRCEYCRLNFASFRKRKEIFTFRRWEKFRGQPGDEGPQERRPQETRNEAPSSNTPSSEGNQSPGFTA